MSKTPRRENKLSGSTRRKVALLIVKMRAEAKTLKGRMVRCE